MEQASILIAGDFYGGRRIEDLIIKNFFDDLFDEFLNIKPDNDLFILNLESPLINNGTPISKSGPPIKANPKIVEALKYLKVDMVTLANNHIYDFGEEGLNNTKKILEENSIDYIGVGNNLQEARDIEYKIINGVKIAFVNFCENEWSTAAKLTAGANPYDLINNFYDISEAKKNADRVIVIFHGGTELHHLPSVNMKEACRFFINIGADVVVCHHTHYYSGFEKFKNGLIFYSLGNFIFDNQNFSNERWFRGYAVALNLSKTDIDFKIIPFNQCKENKLGIYKLNAAEEEEFQKDLETLNKIISNDDLLEEEFNKFVEKVTSQYIGQIQPYSNKYLYGAYKRGYLPSVFNEDKYRLMQNLIRCESHRDILLNILDNKTV